MTACFVLSATAQAATVGFDPQDSPPAPDVAYEIGNFFSIDILATDFPETQGGGVNLFYDAGIVQVQSVTIDNAVWNFINDPGVIDNSAGEISDILVSAFNVSPLSDPSGTIVVASINFQAVGIGVSLLTLTESGINPWATNGDLVNPTFTVGTVRVATVPVPGALALFLSGLLCLFRVKRSQFAG